MGTESQTGRSSREANKTAPTAVAPHEFIDSVDTTAGRRKDASTLLAMFQDVTGEPPRMWGPSIIGFGEYHYTYDSGREGDAPAVAFSPRKASLVVYGLGQTPGTAALLEKLGKFKASVACVYITRLADVDQDVLRELVAMAHRHFSTANIKSLQSQRK